MRWPWLAFFLLSGCVHVPTWQRSALQARPMQDPPDPCSAVLDAHVWAARESMTGASSGSAVACGCN